MKLLASLNVYFSSNKSNINKKNEIDAYSLANQEHYCMFSGCLPPYYFLVVCSTFFRFFFLDLFILYV